MNDPKLQERLEQLGRRLVEDVERWERATRDKRRDALVGLTETVGSRILEAVEKERSRRVEQRQSREERRARRREERREARRRRASALSGVVQLLLAALFATYAALHPGLWWLIFVTLGLALGGTSQLSLVAERRRLAARAGGRDDGPREAALDLGDVRGAGDGARTGRSAPRDPGALSAALGPTPAQQEQQHEVDRLCDQLLADLGGAPEAVRQFIQAPEATIASLRATARALDARRLQLMSEDPAERLQALRVQEESLRTRRDAVDDDETRRRLDDALASIEAQRAATLQLRRAAERVDGEYTSLVVSLQELRTRVVVAKSAGTEVQLDGLRRSVARLNGELEAIGDALSQVASESARQGAPSGDGARFDPEPIDAHAASPTRPQGQRSR